MEVVLGKKTYEVKPVTIRQYKELEANAQISDIDLIHMLTGARKEDIIKAPMAEVKFVAAVLKSEWGAELDKTPLELTIEFNGKLYGLIKPSQISYGEWINLEVFMARSPVDIVLLATHLYRPQTSDKIGDERELIDYDLGECQLRMEEFMDFPIRSVMSALFFLTTFAQELIKTSLSFTETKMKNDQKRSESQPHKK
jgi:hypothetical protein